MFLLLRLAVKKFMLNTFKLSREMIVSDWFTDRKWWKVVNSENVTFDNNCEQVDLNDKNFH